MTSALEAIPALLLALVLFLVPGGAVIAMLRVRGFAAVALIPAISVSIISVSAIVGPWLGLPWGWWVPAIGTILVLAALFLLRRLIPALRTDRAGDTVGAERGLLRWGLLGALVGAVAITVRFLIAVPNLGAITQNYDTVFHLNAVRYVLDAGNASSWFVGEFVRPTAPAPAFYPGAWHALVSLVVQLSGTSIAVATNVVWLATAAVLWPLSLLLLTRALVGPRTVVLAAAGVLAASFSAFPYLLLYYGTAYPNALSNALVPTGVALVLLLLRQGRSPMLSAPIAATLLILYLPGQALSQPNGVFSIVFLLTPLLLLLVVRWLRTGFDASPFHGAKRLIGLLAVIVIGAVVLFSNPTIRGLFHWSHPKSMSFIEALWRSFLQFPLPTWVPAIILTLLLLAGLYVLARSDQRKWMIFSFALTILVYALAVGSNNAFGNALIAPWYGNPDRLAALMPIFGVPLAAVGLSWLCTEVLRTPVRWRPWTAADDGGPGEVRRAPVPISAVVPATAILAALLLTAASPTLWQMNVRLAAAYEVPATPDPAKQLDTDELALLEQLDQYTTEDAVLANNPWNGSSLAVALADREVLYPYMSMSTLDEDRELLSFRLDAIGTSPAVCAAAQRLGVTHLLDFGNELITPAKNANAKQYPGIEAAAESGAFELVTGVGHAQLYKLTECASQ